MGSSGKIIATICLFFAISQTSVLALAIGLFIVKFFSDWSQPTVWGTCTDIGGRHSGTVFSIVNMSGNIGAVLVPVLLLGPLLDGFATTQMVEGVSEVVTNYFPMFVVVAVMYLITAVCWLTVDPSRPIDPGQKA